MFSYPNPMPIFHKTLRFVFSDPKIVNILCVFFTGYVDSELYVKLEKITMKFSAIELLFMF